MALDSNKEIEERLLEAGSRLLHPPSSVDELLSVLDQLEDCLSKVPQSPPNTIQSVLSPVLKALVADNLLRHSNVDVKVALASSISEITRISAPNAPYDDDQMKEAFQLIVSCFENFSDKESRSFNKRISILETVAKVRSCVVMLDLECDSLIVQMFHHFLNSVRDYLPEAIFTCMETIMVLVVDESEDVSLELLTPILSSLKNNTEEFLPTARRLSERVVQSCVTKLKPYLIEAVKSLGIDLEDYSSVLASICVENGSVVEHDDGHVSSANQNAEEVGSHKEVGATEDISLKDVDPHKDVSLRAADLPEQGSSLKAVISNGDKQELVQASLLDSDSLKKNNSQLENISVTCKSEPSADSEAKTDQPRDRRGRKPKFFIKSTELSRASPIDGGNISEKHTKLNSGNSRHETPSVAQTPQLGNENEATLQDSSPKCSFSEAKNMSLPTECGTTVDDTRKAGRPKKRETTNQGAKSLLLDNESKTDLPTPPHKVTGSIPSPIQSSNTLDESSLKKGRGTRKSDITIPEAKTFVDDQKKLSVEAQDSGLKRSKRVRKKKGANNPEEEKVPLAETFKKEIELTKSEGKPLKLSGKKLSSVNNSEVEINLNDLGDKPLKLSGKKANFIMKDVEEPSESLRQYKKRPGRKHKQTEDELKSSAEEVEKEVIAPSKVFMSTKDKEIAKPSSKRKRVSEKDKVPSARRFHGELVGFHIEVLWPDDKMFYSGVIDAYDPVQKKHKVLYDDGDQEILDLRTEVWKIIKEKPLPGAAREQVPSPTSPDPSPPMQQKKKARTSSVQARGTQSSKSGKRSRPSQPKGVAKSSGIKSKEDEAKTADSEDTTSDRSPDEDAKSSKKSTTPKTIPKSGAPKTPKSVVESGDGARSKGSSKGYESTDDEKIDAQKGKKSTLKTASVKAGSGSKGVDARGKKRRR